MKFLMGFLLTIFMTTHLMASERCDVQFKQVSVCANIDWVYGPYLDQYNSARISYTESDKVSSLKIIPWMVMRNHEHGSRPVVLTKTGDRDYLIEKAFFMGGMEGQWFFKVQLLDPSNKLIEEARYLITFKN